MQSAPDLVQNAAPPATGQGFVGSWRITVYEADGPPTLALAAVAADGTLVTAEHPVVTPPDTAGVVFTSAGLGVWRATAPDTAILTFVGLGCHGQGNLFGTVTVRAGVTLRADCQEFSGEFVATIAEPGGSTIATYPGTLRATRIVAEAPQTAAA
jgi:hypothetical protein